MESRRKQTLPRWTGLVVNSHYLTRAMINSSPHGTRFAQGQMRHADPTATLATL